MSRTLNVHGGLHVMSREDRASGLSALRCPHCNQPVTLEDEYDLIMPGTEVYCEACEGSFNISQAHCAVEPGSAALLSVKNARGAVWYHSTFREDWMGDLLDPDNIEWGMPYVHVGTRSAALMRADQMNQVGEEYHFLYAVTLKPGAVIYNKISKDTNSWASYVGEYEEKFDAVRYLNIWESPGSISMLVDPRALQVVSMERIAPLSMSFSEARIGLPDERDNLQADYAARALGLIAPLA